MKVSESSDGSIKIEQDIVESNILWSAAGQALTRELTGEKELKKSQSELLWWYYSIGEGKYVPDIEVEPKQAETLAACLEEADFSSETTSHSVNTDLGSIATRAAEVIRAKLSDIRVDEVIDRIVDANPGFLDVPDTVPSDWVSKENE